MNSVTLSFFAAICLISSAFGTGCSSGPGYRFPITCPGLLDPTKSYCCEIGGSFHCCDEEEFARKDQEYTDNIDPALAPRYKREYAGVLNSSAKLTKITIAIICMIAIFFPTSILYCCFCCACCSGYIWCHRNPSYVTMV